MEPLTIAVLTILALVALMVEYFARTFTRAFGAARNHLQEFDEEQAVPAAPPRGRLRPVDFMPREARETERTLLRTQSNRAMLKSAMRPAASAEAPTLSLVAGRGGPERTARGIDNIVGDLERLVIALGSAQGFGMATEPLCRIEDRLSEYDLDDLMEIVDRDLSVSVIAFYRGVAGTIKEVRACCARLPSDGSTGNLNPLGETEHDSLQRLPMNDVARGSQIAARLRGKDPRHLAARALSEVAIPS